MQLLATLHESDIVPGSRDIDASDFSERLAARAVVLDEHGCVALLWVGKYHYHKLPGGGVERGENISDALQRELMEEIGCAVKATTDIGTIIEYRDQQKLRQTSHCFLATQTGDQSPPSFTEKELSEGFEVVWVKSIDEAIATLVDDKPTNYEGKFIQRRDVNIVEAAQALTTTVLVRRWRAEKHKTE